MSEQERPAIRTTPTMPEFLETLRLVLPDAKQGTFAILWAQYVCETGGRFAFNWNFANHKHFDGDGFDWHALKGVWEGVSAVEAARLVANGEAVYDANGAHQRAVAPKTAVVFNTNHAASRFRAYDSPEHGMREWVTKLQTRFKRAWPPALAGDVASFALALKSHSYMTASAEAYAAVMAGPFRQAMQVKLKPEGVEPNEFTFAPIHGTHIVDWALEQRGIAVEEAMYGFLLSA